MCGDRNSYSDLVRGSCRSISDDIVSEFLDGNLETKKTPQPLQIKFNRGICVQDRSVVSPEGSEYKLRGSRSGALNVNDNGRLRANNYNDNSNPNNWAFGASPSAELLSPFFLHLRQAAKIAAFISA